MATANLKQFKNILDKELRNSANTIGMDIEKNSKEKGAAFEHLIASWFIDAERDFDQKTADDANVGTWGGSNDLSIDLWFTDADQKKTVIVDSKWRERSLSLETYKAFFDSWNIHRVPARRLVGNADVQRKLEDFETTLSDIDQCVEYRLVINRPITPAAQVELDTANAELQRKYGSGTRHKIVVYDLDDLYEYYYAAKSTELGQIPTLEIPIGAQWLTLPDPLQCVVVPIPGKILAKYYYDYGRALYSSNFRGFLGANKVNKKIVESAVNQPEYFFYRNNGISALCSSLKFEEDDSKLVVEGLQIVNGAQTVSSIRKAQMKKEKEGSDLSDDLLVLSRIIEVPEGDLNSLDVDSMAFTIIQANNTQSVIQLTDQQSNAPLQRYLEGVFKSDVTNALFKPYRYTPKRAEDDSSMGIIYPKFANETTITQKDLAKMRYAYLSNDPMSVHGGQANALWDPRHRLPDNDTEDDEEDRGLNPPKYNIAFGVDGEVVDIWEPAQIRQAQFIYALDLFVDKKTAEFKKLDVKRKKNGDDPLYNCFPTMKYHVIALYGAWLKKSGTESWAIGQLDEPEECLKMFEQIVKQAMSEVGKVYRAAMEKQTTVEDLRVMETHYVSMWKSFESECSLQWSNTEDLVA